MQHHLCFPVLVRRFGFLYKVYDGQLGLFTTDDHSNLVRVDPFRVTPSLAYQHAQAILGGKSES